MYRITSLPDALYKHFREQPEKSFCILKIGANETSATYSDLASGTNRFSEFFMNGGVSSGSPVLLFLKQSHELIYAYIGAMWAGMVPSAMPLPSSKQDPVRYWKSHLSLVKRIRPAVILADANSAAEMRRNGLEIDGTVIVPIEIIPMENLAPLRAPKVRANAVALLQHSSGTTGLKKGVALSHAAVAAQINAYAPLVIGPDRNDVIATWLPLYHDMGLMACTILPLALGLTIVMLDPFRWAADPKSLFSAIEKHRATLVWLPNFAFEHLRRTIDPETQHYDLSSVRAFINCSEPCKAETFSRFAQAFGNYGLKSEHLQVCYAAAETVFAITQTQLGHPARELVFDERVLEASGRVVAATHPAGRTIQSCGTVIPNVTVKIVADDGSLLPDDAVGEIAVAGDSLFDGYFELPEQTSECLRDNWYLTRDLGFFHEGELYVLGRKDDLVIVNGRNYFAHDIEQCLSQIAGLKPGRAVAFGVFNDSLGSQEMVVVAERDDTSALPVEVISRNIKIEIFQATNLSIREAVVVPAGWLIKTTSGKISRKENQSKYSVSLRGNMSGDLV